MKSRCVRSASLTFRGFNMTPEEVECMVGVTAESSGIRGNFVKQGVSTLLKCSFIRYEVKFTDGCRLGEMIPKLLAYLGGANHIREAKEKICPEFFEINLVLPVKYSDEQEGGFLPPSTLAELAQLGAQPVSHSSFYNDNWQSRISRKAASGRGCVKTFFSATGTQNQTGNRASTQNPHLLMCR